ncbi:MAG: D-beta-D-heptose 1-phosphate adenosyltransferase [Acidimicrobiales bacterium]|nr:D-beta-D-heptose 1-phosphate adenosyltransferase [Acidimicrobiales bacterium]
MSGSPDPGPRPVDRLVERSRAATVVVLGDVMLDEYVVGEVARTSPEAPVPVVAVRERWSSLGGAANVARQVAAFGAAVELVGSVGRDAAGDRVVAACAEAGVGTALLQRPTDGRPTTVKQRVVAGRQQIVRIDVEEIGALAEGTLQALVDRLAEGSRPDVMVVSDYAKGFVTPALVAAVVALGRRWDVPVLVDPKAADFGRYRGATLVKANRLEFEAAIGRRLGDEPEVELLVPAEELRRRSGIDQLVVTLGARGMVVLDGDHPLVLRQPSEEVFDVSGAGDTVIALLALGLAAGLTTGDAARLANVGSGIAVRKPGVAVVEPDELAEHGHGGARLWATADAAATAVADWRRQGQRVVFTNGCFDLLHPGHLHLLRQAAAEGDRLVVGINGDASVRALKGPDRPVTPAAVRAGSVASVEGVDAVVVFDEPDPGALIDRLGPDVLVKGADYDVADIVGRGSVEQRGGRVVTVGLLPGWSTTEVLRRLSVGG